MILFKLKLVEVAVETICLSPTADSAVTASQPPADVVVNEDNVQHKSSQDSAATSRTQTAQHKLTKRRDVVSLYNKERRHCKAHISLVVAGHVDAGKSTLMGHLLFQLGYVSRKTMHKHETESQKMGKQSFKYAWVLDETAEERSRGVTMDVAQFSFETAHRSITLLDAPGHKDFIPNMITGACVADAAVLVVNATQGEFETGFETGGQTREHAILLRSLGVSQLVVAVNKLDTVSWSESRYTEIRDRLSVFLKAAGFRGADVRFVPCSGLTGQNLTESVVSASSGDCKEENGAALSWYKGPTLVDAIDQFQCAEGDCLNMPTRACISDVFRGGGGGGLCVSCRVDAGAILPSDRLLLLPPGDILTVKNITVDGANSGANVAFAGDHAIIGVICSDPQQISVGTILCDPNDPIEVTSRVIVRLVVFDIDLPITNGYQVEVHMQCWCVPATVTRLLQQLHRGSGRLVKKRPRCLPANCCADVQLLFSRPVCLQLYKQFRQYGRLLLRSAGHTVAAGLVTKIY